MPLKATNINDAAPTQRSRYYGKVDELTINWQQFYQNQENILHYFNIRIYKIQEHAIDF